MTDVDEKVSNYSSDSGKAFPIGAIVTISISLILTIVSGIITGLSFSAIICNDPWGCIGLGAIFFIVAIISFIILLVSLILLSIRSRRFQS